MKKQGKFVAQEGVVVEIELVDEKRRWFDRRWEQKAIQHIERRLEQRRKEVRREVHQNQDESSA